MNIKLSRQEKRIVEYLESGRKLTAMIAMNELGIMSLHTNLSTLRNKGYDIEIERITVRNRFDEKCVVGRYQLGEK